jgi:hypothetical protein
MNSRTCIISSKCSNSNNQPSQQLLLFQLRTVTVMKHILPAVLLLPQQQQQQQQQQPQLQQPQQQQQQQYDNNYKYKDTTETEKNKPSINTESYLYICWTSNIIIQCY